MEKTLQRAVEKTRVTTIVQAGGTIAGRRPSAVNPADEQ